jgi:RNA polymerase sigma-70 factor, ECF subfamily
LFNFSSERKDPNASPRIVAIRQAKQSLESRQLDIYESHRHRAFALAYYMTGNELEAERILTGTFTRAFLADPEPDGQAVDSALLHELRQRTHLRLDSPVPPHYRPCNPADSAASLGGRNVKRTDLEEALWSLPPVERFLFLLRDVEGYTATAIAQLLHMPEPQVQRGLLAARLRLRRILAESQTQTQTEQAA